MALNLKYTFDSNLQENLENPEDVNEHIQRLLSSLPLTSDFTERAKILGNVGAFLRMLKRLDEAQKYLEEAIGLLEPVGENGLLLQIQKIRLAHIFQWQKKFDLSNRFFNDLINDANCGKGSEVIDFIWQHAGKNFFDQHRYAESVDAFNKALKIRLDKGSPVDQIESSKIAILEAQRRIDSQQ